MTDPAVEAAERATANDGGFMTTHDIAAAREALAPLRKHYEELDEYSHGPGDYRAGVRMVLDRIAPLIYPESEL